MTAATLTPHATRVHLWPRLAATSATAGAVLFLAGQALLPDLPNDLGPAFEGMLAHRDQLMAARLLTAAGSLLLTVAGFAFADLLAERSGSPRVVRVGGVLLAIGALFNGLAQAVQGYATYAVTAPGFDQDAGRTVVDTITSGPVGVPLGFWSVPVFALGCVTIAVGLLRGRRAPVWTPVLLIMGTVLAAALAGLGPVVALTQAPFTVALVSLAIFMTAEPTRP